MQNSNTTIGLDLGDKTTLFHLIDDEGEVLEEGSLKTSEKGFRRYFTNRESMRIILEASTHSPWVSRLLQELGHEVIVANPRRTRLISQNEKKTDKVDAELLARLGRVDPKLLSPIKHKTEKTQKALAVINSRDRLVEARTKLINHVRGTVKSYGQRLPGCSADAFYKRVSELELDIIKPMQPVMECIKKLTLEIKYYDLRIDEIGKKQYPETELLRQIKGVGPVTALAFILKLENPFKFKNIRTVGSHLGLCPRKNQSGDNDPELSITKSGDSNLRRLLVNCSSYILGTHGPDTDLKRFGQRLEARGGKRAKKRARVAVARKLAILLYSLWQSGEVYEPLRNSAC